MAQLLLLHIMDVGLLFQSCTLVTFITKSRVYLVHRFRYCKKTVSYNRMLKVEKGLSQDTLMVCLSRYVSFIHFQLFFDIGKFITWQGYWSECLGYRIESDLGPGVILLRGLMIFIKSLCKARSTIVSSSQQNVNIN